jgi:amidohydrolase
MLLKARESWAGTLVFLFQPAEEHGDGALKMVADGLYDPKRHACPLPDIVLGQHVGPIPAGVVAAQAGTVMNSSDALKITVFGRGGHGSMPHRCIDPVVIAAHIIVRLQTIVSREVPPDEVAVITVGSVHAGEKENVISDKAVFKISIRSNVEEVRMLVLESIHRIVEAECSAARCEKPPTIEHMLSIPVVRNAVAVDNHLKPGFASFFSGRFLGAEKGALASEDFSILATSIDKPYYFWFFGGIDQKQWDERAKANELDKIPVNHSPFFAPAIHPTLQTGGDALVVATLTYLLEKPTK